MQKTKIEWADYAWNPIKGICPVGCWYCYARRMYQRFKWNPKMSFELHDSVSINKLWKKNIPDGSKVFVCSTFELFHTEVPKSWRKDIFDTIKLNPKIIFQVLTKFPQNIDRPMPDNVWLGVTVTKDADWWRAKKLQEKSIKAKIKFLSLEPLFERVWLKIVTHIDWIIIGRLTGHGNKYNPPKDWLMQYMASCIFWNKPLFMKDNLKEIWGEPLIQEFPSVR